MQNPSMIFFVFKIAKLNIEKSFMEKDWLN